jgi:lipoprotein-releasing system permease protein
LRSLASIGRPVDTGRATHARFRVAAIVHSGFYDYDNRLIVTDYRVLQDLFGRGDSVTGVEVRFDDVEQTDVLRAQLESVLTTGRYRVLDWRDINRNLFRSLNLQKLALTIVMSVLVIVGSSVILCVLVMMVLQKRREIAVLRALGATSGGMVRIFMLEGFVIGAAGTAIGLVGGLVVCAILKRIDFGLEFAVYRIDSLPVTVNPVEFALAGAGALVICLLATIYPARRAASVSPVEVLRYD